LKNAAGFVIFRRISIAWVLCGENDLSSYPGQPVISRNALASVDLGTHTARLLVALPEAGGTRLRPLARDRRTIRLARGMGREGGFAIPEDAADRAVSAIREFTRTVLDHDGVIAGAVCTGVVRTAANREAFLKSLRDETGVEFRLITGEEEALLTLRGVLSAVGRVEGPFLLFDLGGGSTELIAGSGVENTAAAVESVPLGALALKEAYLRGDPPGREELEAVEAAVDRVLEGVLLGVLPLGKVPRLIGTGGTATTLAAMARGVEFRDISPERMDGTTLGRDEVEGLFEKMIRMTSRERCLLTGVDEGRADVLPAGTVVVRRIMHFLGVPEMSVCLSDILEGILISYLEGFAHEQ